MTLVYDAPIVYDTPDYTYDGYFVGGGLTIQEALFRELKYGTVLQGLVPAENIKLDMRPEVSSTLDSYPWVTFRRVTSSEDNLVRYARERWEIEVIGQAYSQIFGDDLLQQIQEALLDEFAGNHKTWGQFSSSGVADANTGLRMKCHHVNTVELLDELGEKMHVLIFLFTYVREVSN